MGYAAWAKKSNAQELIPPQSQIGNIDCRPVLDRTLRGSESAFEHLRPKHN